MAQPRILQNIRIFWTFLDYFKNFTSWLIASEALLRNTANTEISKREGKVMSLLTFCALSSWKVPWVLFFPSLQVVYTSWERLLTEEKQLDGSRNVNRKIPPSLDSMRANVQLSLIMWTDACTVPLVHVIKNEILQQFNIPNIYPNKGIWYI